MFTESQAETAMCLWEAVTEANIARNSPPWRGYQEGNGTVALRLAVLGLAPACEADWEEVVDAYTLSFDWDFCPRWLNERVEWDSYGPEVKREGRDKWLHLVRKYD